jgi:predicted RNase H-like nuclease
VRNQVSHVKGRTQIEVFANKFLRRIFRLRRDKVTGGWRKLHNKELHNLHSSLNIIKKIKSRRMNWAGRVACVELRTALGRPRRRLQNIKKDLMEMGLKCVD